MQLAGSSLRDDSHSLPTLQLGGVRSPSRTMGYSIESLRRGLSEAARRARFGRDPSAFPTISVAGFEDGRFGTSPLVVSLVWSSDTKDYVRRNPPRGWHLQEARARVVLGVGVAYQHEDIMAELRSELVEVDSFLACRQAMIRAVRKVANRDGRVGKDVMAVEVSREPVGTIEVFFEAGEPAADVTMQLGASLVTVSDPWYSPWVVGRSLTSAPTLHIGPSTTISGGGLRIVLHGSTTGTGPTAGTVLLLAPQVRRPRPVR